MAKLGAKFRRVLVIAMLVAVLVPFSAVQALRFGPAPANALAFQRVVEGKGFARDWRPLRRISPNLVYAVIASEDARFCTHHGFDFEAIAKALKHNARGKGRTHGGSTISQQTAKNAFLWPGRDWVRKGAEVGYTVLIETLWGKRRIMEVYLNVVEWAPGVYGAQAAARRWYGVDADQLTPSQSARLAAILPRPLKWKAAASGPYVKKRSGRIGKSLGVVRREGLAACVLGPRSS